MSTQYHTWTGNDNQYRIFTIIQFLVACHPVSSNTVDNNEYFSLGCNGDDTTSGESGSCGAPVQARIVKVDLLHPLQIIKVICLQMVELEMGLDLSLEEIVDTTAVFIPHLHLAQITTTIIMLISKKVEL